MIFSPKIKDFLSKLTVSENKFTGVGGKTTKKSPVAPWYVQWRQVKPPQLNNFRALIKLKKQQQKTKKNKK